MSQSSVAPSSGPRLRRHEFDALRRVAYERTGISLNDSKLALAESRLGPRLRALGLRSFSAYLHLLEAAGRDGGEMVQFINSITTNKTGFFREAHHFDFLENTVVPEIVERARRSGERKIRIWSAGCSTGQEPYTIAATLAEALRSTIGAWDVRILASDIDTAVLSAAEEATYDASAIDEVPVRQRARMFDELPGGDVRVKRVLRDMVTFRRINLVDSEWPIRTHFDVIFCRNVVIYFDRATQERLYESFVQYLRPDGYLIAGHSENLHWLGDILAPSGGTVYRPLARSVRERARAPRRRSLRPRASQAPQIPQVFIEAGGVKSSGRRVQIRTVLGSCISVCLYDPAAGVGGMNHFMLPDGNQDTWRPTHFGLHAMEVLINGMMKLGADRRRMVAKIFGGAKVIAGLSEFNDVGARNIEFVTTFLADEKIPLVAKKVGGESPLAVRFDTGTGKVRVSAVESSLTSEIATAESSHLRSIDRTVADPSADVILF